MTPNVRLDHCVVHVSDWPRSNAFYRDVLGAELLGAGAGWSYRFGDQQLNVHGPGLDAAPVAGSMTDVEHISRKGMGVPVSCFPMPEQSEPPENLRGLFRTARETVGFVPNAFRAYSFRPERLSGWFAHYRQLYEPRTI